MKRLRVTRGVGVGRKRIRRRGADDAEWDSELVTAIKQPDAAFHLMDLDHLAVDLVGVSLAKEECGVGNVGGRDFA